jgi:hypothetical protein
MFFLQFQTTTACSASRRAARVAARLLLRAPTETLAARARRLDAFEVFGELLPGLRRQSARSAREAHAVDERLHARRLALRDAANVPAAGAPLVVDRGLWRVQHAAARLTVEAEGDAALGSDPVHHLQEGGEHDRLCVMSSAQGTHEARQRGRHRE